MPSLAAQGGVAMEREGGPVWQPGGKKGGTEVLMSGQEKLWRLNQKIRNTKACDEGVTRCVQAIKVVLSVWRRGPTVWGLKEHRDVHQQG